MDIVEFLSARLDEDEALAGLATEAPWHVETAPHRTNVIVPAAGIDRVGTTGRRLDMPPIFTGQTANISRAQWEADAQHIARHDHARVLREVEAKRAIVALHGDYDTDPCLKLDDSAAWDPALREPCDTLKLLAAPYANHLDFKQAWRVE